jgi:SWIM zinc finger
LTPPLFHGPTITTSPLEKLNDMIKNEVTHSSNPRIIVPKIETIVTRGTKNNVQLEKSKLTLAHQDYHLEDARRSVSSKIFFYFYQNYVKTEEVVWRMNPSELFEEYSRGRDADQGIHVADRNKEEFQVNLNWCSCEASRRNGIPCVHLISLRKSLGKDYKSCFAGRWLMENDEEARKKRNEGQLMVWKEKVGKPRISRKKRHN